MNGKDKATSKGRTYRVAVPKTRDPFVNTPLLSLGRDRRGRERFWISTYNGDASCQGVLLEETGEYRIVKFDREQHGCYSAAMENSNTLWLCGHLERLVRLDLRTMRFRTYPTGAPRALVFQGMVFDPATAKLFAAAFPPPQTTAFSFDTRRRKTAKIHSGFTGLHYMRFSFPNGDGTYSIVMHTPGAGLLVWDPRRETVETVFEQLDAPADLTYRLVSDGKGRWYVPSLGWYDPAKRTFESARPAPEREMAWFAAGNGRAYGALRERENLAVGCWDFQTGRVKQLFNVADSGVANVNLSQSGKLVAVDVYGTFCRWDAATGALEQSVRLKTDAHVHTDRVCRLDRDTILGTPFISQRFWLANIRTGNGTDCGRAAPGGGEILAVWKLRDKAYMAAYTGGELMEFDPRRPARFPENPRVVADPPRGMRPIASAQDARCIYYSCSAPYGELGCTLTRYDTRTREASYAQDPIPGQSVCSLYYDGKRRALLAGTTPHADCQSRAAAEPVSCFARISADTLAVEWAAPAPEGVQTARVIGPLKERRWLCTGQPAYNLIDDRRASWFDLDFDSPRMPDRAEPRPFPKGLRRIEYAGRPGLFVLLIGRRVEVWNLLTGRCIRRLADGFGGYGLTVQDRSVYLLHPKTITVLDDCLERLREDRT